jgi:hypothetical protein
MWGKARIRIDGRISTEMGPTTVTAFVGILDMSIPLIVRRKVAPRLAVLVDRMSSAYIAALKSKRKT